MAEGVVRVEERIGGKVERVRVSAHHVEQYLAEHPHARVLDADWRTEAAKALTAMGSPTATPKAEDKK